MTDLSGHRQFEMQTPVMGGNDRMRKPGADNIVRLREPLFQYPLRADRAADFFIVREVKLYGPCIFCALFRFTPKRQQRPGVARKIRLGDGGAPAEP